jgi:hypothetical protein
LEDGNWLVGARALGPFGLGLAALEQSIAPVPKRCNSAGQKHPLLARSHSAW